MKAWYLVFTEVMTGKYNDLTQLLEVPLFSVTEDDALVEAKEKLTKIIDKINDDFESRKKTNPTSFFTKKQVENPHLVLKIPISF